ncbi:MAG TPA: LppX_LprAFG lipoprotein [Ktedonobacteraceae bacterium]|nr:LppX_LprAFG lipoprotein [Ktedonobacteraceae bacterium]
MYRLPAYHILKTRRRSWLAAYLCCLLFLLAACGGGGNSSTPDAHTILKNAQAAIQKVKSYHFTLKGQNISPNSKLPITSADGDLLVPDKLRATGTVIFSGNNLQVQLVVIGNQQYINLLGAWQTTSGLLDPRALTDSKTGIAGILGHIQNPSTPTDSSVNGQACWNITGKLDPNYLSGLTGGGAPPGTLDDISTCIGKSDNLPYQIIVTGIATQGDTSKTVRTLTLSHFNEQITITAPTASALTHSV